MRTTLDIDDDVLRAVKERARREGRSAGAVVSDLVRESLTRSVDMKPDEGFFGFSPLPHRGPVVSNALVDELREEIGE
ncbi:MULTISPECIES: CopG family transcriptional regulator [Mumia]|uniref:ribbon-helix-helix domain-containing protein n=1 Tax=Mumia TaxID=1546255 RepID=UPI00142274FD|nr:MULTISPECIES: CopG family transcriptional regulator [unclassified Mumia]QMW64887.1 ribbon-helix-helix protein, CopG family [Mumia sp. ZJ1417]